MQRELVLVVDLVVALWTFECFLMHFAHVSSHLLLRQEMLLNPEKVAVAALKCLRPPVVDCFVRHESLKRLARVVTEATHKGL